MLGREKQELFLYEGQAVGALIHGRIGLVGANRHAVERAVILIGAVIFTVADGTADAMVCVAVHKLHLLGKFRQRPVEIVCAVFRGLYRQRPRLALRRRFFRRALWTMEMMM